MAIQKVKFDNGEKRHIRTEVYIKEGEELPFKIINATYQLLNPNGRLEASGNCHIDNHELDCIIEPKSTGEYILRFIYEVADETWVDPVRVVVS
ncbi:hypothetical protein [Murimonas intestini]|uniref:hypothetical protein n=1 Tax=Murimonas intestini TaxID=1337051 RepID=UPI0011DCEE27|nr:hypothetical protein [Murimonas intestini]